MLALNSNRSSSSSSSSMVALVLLATLLVYSNCIWVQAEPLTVDSSNLMANNGRNSQGSSSNVVNQQEFGSPKRQYLIAPRIGRSSPSSSVAFNNGRTQQQQQAILSALEEAALNQINGQVQVAGGNFPGPLRSSLLFLVSGNRRTIGQRSSGLLPQARIGRRAAPIGYIPQPRVGRRSIGIDDYSQSHFDNNSGRGGQEEVAVATMSDSSLSDAIEALVEG